MMPANIFNDYSLYPEPGCKNLLGLDNTGGLVGII